MPRWPSDPSQIAPRQHTPDDLPTDLGSAPPGVQHRVSLHGEEVHLPRTRPTHMLQIAVILGIVAAGVAIAGFMGGMQEVSLLIMLLSAGGLYLLHRVHQRFRKAPPQVVALSPRSLTIDGHAVPWDDVVAIKRAHTGRGGAVVISTAEHAWLLGGELRPSGVDWLQALLARHRAGATQGSIDPEGHAALEQLRART